MKLARGWRTDTIDRATTTIHSSLKSAAEHLENVAVNVTYRPRPLALVFANITARYEKASAERTRTRKGMLFHHAVIAARSSSGAFCFRGNMRASFRHYPTFYSDGIKNTDHARRPLCNFRVIVPFAVPVFLGGKAEAIS